MTFPLMMDDWSKHLQKSSSDFKLETVILFLLQLNQLYNPHS